MSERGLRLLAVLRHMQDLDPDHLLSVHASACRSDSMRAKPNKTAVHDDTIHDATMCDLTRVTGTASRSYCVQTVVIASMRKKATSVDSHHSRLSRCVQEHTHTDFTDIIIYYRCSKRTRSHGRGLLHYSMHYSSNVGRPLPPRIPEKKCQPYFQRSIRWWAQGAC